MSRNYIISEAYLETIKLRRDNVLQHQLSNYKIVGECWIWLGLKNGGFGQFTINKKNYKAHRFFYEHYKGSIPGRKTLQHTCPVTPVHKDCVNPGHLKIAKGRSPASGRRKEPKIILKELRLPKSSRQDNQLTNYVINEHGCWVWQGGKCKDGYPKLKRNKKTIRGHRLFYEIHKGPIPEGLWVLHSCPGGDNPACVNPGHLWVGTHLENEQDKDRKGRRPKPWPLRYPELVQRGENHSCSKLDENQAIALKISTFSVKKLELEFNLSKSSICRIRSGKSWKHLTPEYIENYLINYYDNIFDITRTTNPPDQES